MARRARIENAGYHHIYNRGVERRVVFSETKDKDKFLDIVCEVSKHYDFTIHGYAIMDNHYHLILENHRENLSAGMRQINAAYAQYFNKKENRVGHLWQGRFKSWYIFDENYLFTLFRYLEFNPIKARITKSIGKFRYTLTHDLLNHKLRDCMQDSFVLEWFDSTSELLKSLGIGISEEESEKINQFQKIATAYKKDPKKIEQKLDIKDYFQKEMSKEDRNTQILKSSKDGFSGSEIAKFLGLSDSAISRIIKNQNSNPDPNKKKEITHAICPNITS